MVCVMVCVMVCGLKAHREQKHLQGCCCCCGVVVVVVWEKDGPRKTFLN